MELGVVLVRTLKPDRDSAYTVGATALGDEALALIAGGQGLGGYAGSHFFGGPSGFGGYGTVATPYGVITWGATSGPGGFSTWLGRGFHNLGGIGF